MSDAGSLPKALIEGLRSAPGFDEEAFISVHRSGEKVVSIRLNPNKSSAEVMSHLPINNSVPWAREGRYLSGRPSFTFDPLFHAGAYYVQEASSMFLEHALSQLTDLSQPLTVLDLCAAPGGKSTHIQSLISAESVLVSNELVKQRANILMENLTKWGADNVIVTNNDPVDFSQLAGVFDVIVVDAPCSGSGLFRKDPDAIAEWSEANVLMCSQRQEKILQDVWPALKPGGLLIYSTCSYSVEEDEAIADFMTESLAAENKHIDIQPGWGVTGSLSGKFGNKGYRFYPDKVQGEGFYLSCFVKQMDEKSAMPGKPVKHSVDKKILTLAASWLMDNAALDIYQYKEQLFAMTKPCLQLFLFIQKRLHVRKAGIKLGDIARNDIIPDHALALSTHFSNSIAIVALDKEQAIAFLRKEIFNIDHLAKGWLICTYEGFAIGWIKSLGNRFNNYYPKEWRIRS